MEETEKIKKKIINILVADDHQLVRDGITVMLTLIKKNMKFNIIASHSGEDVLTKLENYAVDIILLDYQMPGLTGAETTRRILRFKPMMKILALSNYDEISYVTSMIDAGAHGYILKSIDAPELLTAIKTILLGKLYFSHEIALKLVDTKLLKNVKPDPLEKLISKRELQVLQLIGMEYTNHEIAERLQLSKRTIETHRLHLISKLNVKNSVGLIKAAYKFKLIKP